MKRTKTLTKPKLFIRDLERPARAANAKGKATTLDPNDSKWWKDGGNILTFALGERA